ncbi:MAG: TIGR02996 domain-containing protein, partial [Deltaproteobacteria bacterium]|nr:TIGR02996 domain-containing protein [Deltaproteobacteria bacterium]
MSLETAVEALQKNEPAQALSALLVAWRGARHPRIADAIDVVSQQIANIAPIPGKSVTERDDHWRAIAKKPQPTELPRLLAALWPKQWRPARPLLDLLDKWPEDPRLAAALVRAIVDPPYNSNASMALYELMFEKLGKLGDRRGLDALRDAAVRHRYLAAGIAKTIAAIEKRPLPPIPDEPALAQITAHFAHVVASAANDEQRGAELLSAIYAAPDDDAPRAVYADWLSERGDVRGEFITLQLARGAGEEPSTREKALLHEHGRSWAGRLGTLFSTRSHVFERGFFAGGSLDAKDLRLLAADPASRIVRHVEASATPEALFELLDALPALRSVSTWGDAALAFVGGGRVWPNITSLGTSVQGPEMTATLASCRALPNLRELQIWCGADDAAWLPSAPVLDRVETLRLLGSAGLAEMIAAIIARPSAVRTLEIESKPWRATLRAPFEACTIECFDTSSWYVPASLNELLGVLPATTHVTIVDAHKLDPAVHARVQPALEWFTTPVVASWQPPRPVETSPVLAIQLHGRPLLDAALAGDVWQLLADAGQRYDGIIVGSGKSVRPLGDDPVARISTWANNAKTDGITLVSSQGGDRVELQRKRGRWASPNFNRAELALVERDGIDLVPIFARLAALAHAEWGYCDPQGH